MATDLTKVRNIGICAHIDAGKTTVTERVLYYTGKNYKLGEVHEGTATMDFLEEEQERGITIQSAATTCPWEYEGNTYTVNLIDTPGHVDFTIEVERSLRVLDGAVAVFDGKEGVEAQSETVWRQADRYNVPRICFINKMDKIGADFEFSFDSIRDRLGANAIAVQLPIGAGNELEGIIDLLEMKAYYFDASELGARIEQRPIPDHLLEDAQLWHHRLVEEATDLDDTLAELFLEDEDLITTAQIKAALRRGTIELRCSPVFCGAALRNIGIQRVLNGVIDYLPNPTEVKPVEGLHPRKEDVKLTRPHSEDAPFSALVFKVVSDTHGDLTYMRVYSGRIDKGARLLNANDNKKEIISRIFEMHAKDREPLDGVGAGQIVAVIGPKHSVTGDTLCDTSEPILLERIHFPEPVITMSIEPQTNDDKTRLADAIQRLAIKAALRRGTIELRCSPVFCGAALRNIGIQRVLNGVIDYLPNPTEVKPVEGLHPRKEDVKLTRPHSEDAPFSALVFKVVSDTHGDLTYMRVYSGRIDKGARLLNANDNKKEIISRIFEMHAKDREPLDGVGAGQRGTSLRASSISWR